ncbi:Gfo/Idh/MocA family oxidoreductase [Candidatus Electronema sp. JM]|uniref:Gfo/Idh/MocA family oxidoreductase n=1 Tax=Candidatus Electronema sp. JM TaxID=3401571 RepID=UPI003AA9238C
MKPEEGKVRVGVIGVGYLGRFHAQKYAAMQDVRLAGVADIDFARAEAVAAECGTVPFADYRELLEQTDAVSIVVPTIHHHQTALACLERGVDILLEKPMTTTLAEADEVIALAEEKQLILQVGHLERFNPAVLAVQPLLKNPLFIEAHRLSVFKNRGTDVDVILDLMIHDIDIILSMVNSPIQGIHTVGAPVVTQLTDIANARVIFENGCTANITVSRISLENVRKMRIFQPGRYLAVDFSKKEVTAVRLKSGSEGGIPLPDISRHAFQEQDVLELELREFVANVQKRRSPTVSGLEGRRALELALAVISQIKENQGKFAHLLGTEGNFGFLQEP